MMVRLTALLLSTALASATAQAQVFVIGNGLGGECYERTERGTGSFRQAEQICTRALQEQSMTGKNRAATYVNRGILRMRNGDYDDALRDYEAAINLKSDLGPAYLNKGAALIYKKEFSQAVSSLDKAIDLNSDQLFAAHYNRAIARENSGDVPGAYADFQTALELKPDWDLVLWQLSRFKVQSPSGS